MKVQGERELLWKEVDRVRDGSYKYWSGEKSIHMKKIVFEDASGNLVYALESNEITLTSDQLLELSNYYLTQTR